MGVHQAGRGSGSGDGVPDDVRQGSVQQRLTDFGRARVDVGREVQRGRARLREGFGIWGGVEKKAAAAAAAQSNEEAAVEGCTCANVVPVRIPTRVTVQATIKFFPSRCERPSLHVSSLEFSFFRISSYMFVSHALLFADSSSHSPVPPLLTISARRVFVMRDF